MGMVMASSYLRPLSILQILFLLIIISFNIASSASVMESISWPSVEGGFASGAIDLGSGLHVFQTASFNKIWSTQHGGPDNLGASFFEPSQLPPDFHMLGTYSQPNANLNSRGWILAAKDATKGGDTPPLKQPVDYTLVWNNSSDSEDGTGYFWLPVPPDGYRAVGHVITTAPDKPSLDKIRCVRLDLTNECHADAWLWGPTDDGNPDPTGFNVFSLKPIDDIMDAPQQSAVSGVTVGTFIAQSSGLPNQNSMEKLSASMPNFSQIKSLFKIYSPWIYLHPNEEFLPSSVDWFFNNGALLFERGKETNPIRIDQNGLNLPQGGSNDGAFWLDLPADGAAKDRVKISNFNGLLQNVYFSQHSAGQWVGITDLEYQAGSRPVVYPSLHGHAMYPRPGLVMLGSNNIGIRDDTAKGGMVVDTAAAFTVVAAEYLGKDGVVEPPWLNYMRKWGPKIDYNVDDELAAVRKLLPGKLKTAFNKIVSNLPKEVLGEEGPTGPKVKASWTGDEV
ncbi:Hypothetical protein At1g04090 [Linum perenne]